MIEKRFFDFRSPANSNLFNRLNQGVLLPGPYAGFDDINGVSAGADDTAFSFVHTTGYKSIREDGSKKAGVARIITPEGVTIEYESVDNFAVDHETTGEPRIDLVVIEHDWQDVQGGQGSGISVIKGTPDEEPVAPNPTSPDTQTVLGSIKVEANGNSFQHYTFTKNENTSFVGNLINLDALKNRLGYLEDKIDQKAWASNNTQRLGLLNNVNFTNKHAGVTVSTVDGLAIVKDEWGFVRMWGKFALDDQNTVNRGDVLFKLPVAFRPAVPIAGQGGVRIPFQAANFTQNIIVILCEVKTNGDVVFHMVVGGLNNGVENIHDATFHIQPVTWHAGTNTDDDIANDEAFWLQDTEFENNSDLR